MPSLNDLYKLVVQAEKEEAKNKKFMENLMSWKKPKEQKTAENKPAKKGWGWSRKNKSKEKRGA